MPLKIQKVPKQKLWRLVNPLTGQTFSNGSTMENILKQQKKLGLAKRLKHSRFK
jgi:hypothetical protein